jgi:putative transposase
MVKPVSRKVMVMRESRMQGQPARPVWRELGRNGSQQWEYRAPLPPYITYIRLRDEFVYLAVIMDVFTRSIRGWHLGRSLDQTLTLIALDRALAVHAPEIHHSDQGIQYAAAAYIEMLRAAGAEISMAEIGEAWQNGYAERLIRTIKEEEVDLSDYECYTDAVSQLGRFLNDVYMHKRIHSSLGYLTPAEFEEQWRRGRERPLDVH